MLTSGEHHGDLARSQELGIAAYLTKPVRREELRPPFPPPLLRESKMAAPPKQKNQPGRFRHTRTGLQLQTRFQMGEVRSLHILLAEDNKINQLVACGILKQAGHTVRVADNGAEVGPLLAADTFDVVLMDIQMPIMDGFQATAAIREKEKQTGAHLPIIAMTAHALSGYKEKCLAAGMDGYVTKPVRQDLLLNALAEFQAQAPASESGAAWEVGSELPDKNQFDTDDLMDRLMGNEELAKKLAGAFVADMPGQLNALANAIGLSDPQQAMFAAHSIKGVAANMGCGELRELASRVEEMGSSGILAQASEVLRAMTATFEAVKPAIQRFSSAK